MCRPQPSSPVVAGRPEVVQRAAVAGGPAYRTVRTALVAVVPSGSVRIARYCTVVPAARSSGVRSSNTVYAGDEASMPIGVHGAAGDAALETHHVGGPLRVGHGAHLDGAAHVAALGGRLDGDDRRRHAWRRVPRWSTVCPPLSSTTARYCTGVPACSPLTSWNTWYGALSSVPTDVHGPSADLGVERHLVERGAADVRGHLHAAAGLGGRRRRVQRHRRAPRASGGCARPRRRPRRTAAARSASACGPRPCARGRAPLPYTRRKFRLPTYVGTAAVLGCSLLFSATTYSRCSVAVDPGERVDAGAAVGVAALLRAVAQRRVLPGHRGQLG